MSAAEALRALLLSDTTIAAAVGTRVHPLAMPPEATLPAIVYREISGVAGPVSTSNVLTGVEMITRFQFDIWATTYAQIKTLKDALIKLINRYRGVVSSVTIVDIVIDLTFDTYDSDLKIYRQSVDARVAHVGT